ncbi:hypothetical protein GCM10029976_078270 [Kribbella albertanoniae]|uniref:Uncharacterized protein n=1 Tax=Kribbella albertanoniae TaxID=1266829 RepID=A0A4V2XPS9_9ACTN|nr:hypothetical protein [Kribbella albertanoniae]TDC23195.1 hypothetical protein E1261_29050 [Kribbella albertanoniae]
MTGFTLRIGDGIVLYARHQFVTVALGPFVCSRFAADPEAGSCKGLILSGEPHALVTVNSRPLLRWCATCASGIFGQPFSDWQALR